MAGDFDHSDFVDPDLQGQGAAAGRPRGTTSAAVAATPVTSASLGSRPPSKEDIGRQVTQAQEALVRLKRQQEDLERERTQLEEARRRRLEFEQGREEMLVHLTRGLGILTEAEQSARRDAEQMTRTLVDLQAALDKVSALNEQSWTADTYPTELTRALTTLENARMEWNAAQLKWPRLKPGAPSAGNGDAALAGEEGAPLLDGRTPAQLARLGLALTWPVAGAVLVAGIVLAVVLSRR